MQCATHGRISCDDRRVDHRNKVPAVFIRIAFTFLGRTASSPAPTVDIWNEVKEFGLLQAELSPHLGFSLGNVATCANAGITLRIGNDLAGDYGVPRIRPSLPGSSFFEPVDGSGWYVFAGIDARAVAYNIFLEGDSPTYGVDLDKEASARSA